MEKIRALTPNIKETADIIMFRPLTGSDIKINYTRWIYLSTTVKQAFKTYILFKPTCGVHTKKCNSASQADFAEIHYFSRTRSEVNET
jgi:hypothetical protein